MFPQNKGELLLRVLNTLARKILQKYTKFDFFLIFHVFHVFHLTWVIQFQENQLMILI